MHSVQNTFFELRPNLKLRKSLHQYHLFIVKIHPLKQSSIPVKHSNIHVRNSFFSPTYTKSLNQKATATHFLFLLFKIPFLELRPSLRIGKSFHKCHFLTFQNAYMFECKLFTDPNTTSHNKIIRIPLAFVHK